MNDDTKKPFCDHHLVLGETKDILTGETLADTLDERLRQEIARFLLEEKGFLTGDIRPRHPVTAKSGEKRALVLVDFSITLKEVLAMIVRYGPGSLVTRERPALAASRLMADYQAPVVVVTNGRDAHVLDGFSGKVTGRGLSAIPGREELLKLSQSVKKAPIDARRAEMEGRILYTFEAVGACNCDG